MSFYGNKVKLIYSGGGYFRILPFALIKSLSNRSDYLMTYFHPRDFDYYQPVIQNLPFHRKIKSYVGLKGAFLKLERYLNNFDFLSLEDADKLIKWNEADRLKINF